jgi:putative alpha-1,2-mannosidase
MHTWTPQTGKNGDGWKYQYKKDNIRGFQQAHQCSSWTNDYCVFPLIPITGKLVVDEDERAAKFSHANEIAKPNYYKVKLDGYTGMSGIKVFPAEHKITGDVHNGRGLTAFIHP